MGKKISYGINIYIYLRFPLFRSDSVSLARQLLVLVLVRIQRVTKVLKLSIADFALNYDTLKLTIFFQLLTVTKK